MDSSGYVFKDTSILEMNIKSLKECIKELESAIKKDNPNLYEEILVDIKFRCDPYIKNARKNKILGEYWTRMKKYRETYNSSNLTRVHVI